MFLQGTRLSTESIRNLLASVLFLQLGLLCGTLFSKYVTVEHVTLYGLASGDDEDVGGLSPPANRSTPTGSPTIASTSTFSVSTTSTRTASEHPSENSTAEKNSSFVVLLVLIKSAPRNYERRQRCRSAWQWRAADGAAVIPGLLAQSFVVGIDMNQTDSDKVNDAVQAEQKRFVDITFFPAKDFYYGLTWKALWSFRHALKCCNFDMLLFGDDDVYINFSAWFQWIGGTVVKHVYAGSPQISSRAYRYNGSRWYVSKEQWPKEYYPPYCEGGGYMLSHDVVEALQNESPRHPIFNFDDVFVGVLVEGTRLLKRPTAIPAYFRYTRSRCTEPSPFLILPDDAAHWDTISARQKNSEPLCDPPKEKPKKVKKPLKQHRVHMSAARRRASHKRQGNRVKKRQ